MECTGAGQRRFKFIHQDGPTEQGGPGQQLSIVQVPASRDALIAGNLGSRLQVADIRYDTSWLGDFLHMIPERIGTNKALDSAADTFTTGFNNLDNPHGQPTQMLTKYGDTLRALRDTIGDPAQREAPETMYAMYLVLLSEVSTLAAGKQAVI